MNSNSNRNQVYYIPVGLTQVQRDLLEILISIHAESFLECVDRSLLPRLYEASGTDGSTVKRELSMAALTSEQLTEWFFENIRAVSNHPCLLVEHYMPRQFLLMEPTEQLISTSDKFCKLNLMVNLLLNRKERSEPLQIAIISHSVKELDLIEGVMLGKVAKLKRLSGTSLFDEKHEYDDQTSALSSTPGENGSAVASTSPEPNGKGKDDYQYSGLRRKRKSPELDWLFLATTTHLTHSEDLLSKYNLDMIISFDPLLDESLESIYKVRKNGKRIPMIKLLVQDSPDHYLLSKKKSHAISGELLTESVEHFLRFRAVDKNLISLKQYEGIVSSLVKDGHPGQDLPSVDISVMDNNAEMLPFLIKPLGLMPLSYGRYELRPQVGPWDIKTYQHMLKQLVGERLNQCHIEFNEREKIVLETRLNETKRLNNFDDMKVEAGENFKKLKANEIKLNDSEKRVTRTRSELETLDQRLKKLLERKTELMRLLELEDVSEEIKSQTEQREKLLTDLEALRKENETQTIENDQLRSTYQEKSSEAAAAVSRLAEIKTVRDTLNCQLNGPLYKWELKALDEKEKNLKSSLRHLVQQSQFLIQYMNRMQTQYKIENQPVKSTSSSANSSSRYTRTTRATSPTYT